MDNSVVQYLYCFNNMFIDLMTKLPYQFVFSNHFNQSILEILEMQPYKEQSLICDITNMTYIPNIHTLQSLENLEADKTIIVYDFSTFDDLVLYVFNFSILNYMRYVGCLKYNPDYENVYVKLHPPLSNDWKFEVLSDRYGVMIFQLVRKKS